MEYFLTNPEGYYFVIEEDVPLKVEYLKRAGCIFHPTVEDMYKYVCESCGLDIDEVQYGEVKVCKIDNGQMMNSGLNGGCYSCVDEEGNLQDINDWLIEWIV